MKPSPISPTVDLDRDGVQHGFLLFYSRDDAAWGAGDDPDHRGSQRQGPHRLAHRRQPWRRVRGCGRAEKAQQQPQGRGRSAAA